MDVLYSAVSSPVDRSKRFTLRPCSFRHQVGVSTSGDYSITFPPLSIARYSFIQLSELGHRGENENAQNFETVAKGIRTRTLLIASPAFYRATQRVTLNR